MKYYFFTLEVDYPNYTSKYSLVDAGKSMAHLLHFYKESEKKPCRIICFEELTKKVYDELTEKEWFS